MAKTREKDAPERPVVRSDAYVMMLFVTLLAIAVGCVLMYLDYQAYGEKAPPKENIPTPAKLGEAEPKAPGSTG